MMTGLRLLGMLMLLTVTGADAREYQVVLERPERVGDHYQVDIAGKVFHEVLSETGGKGVKREFTDMTLKLKAEVSVSQIDKQKRPSACQMTVSSCTATFVGNVTNTLILPPGSILYSSYVAGVRHMTVDGVTPKTPQLFQLMDFAFSLANGELTDDDVAGTKTRKKTGESWLIDTTAFADSLESDDMDVSRSGSSGTVKLGRVGVSGGVNSMRVSGDMTVKKLKPKMARHMKVKESLATFSFARIYPVDVTKPTLANYERLTVDISASGKPKFGAPKDSMTFRRVAERTERRTYTP